MPASESTFDEDITADATSRNATQQLTDRQLRGVDLIALGSSDRTVADELGVDRASVWRWRTRDTVFRAALNRRREELWRGSHDRIRSLLPAALDLVEERIGEGDVGVAVNVLKSAGIGGSRSGPCGTG